MVCHAEPLAKHLAIDTQILRFTQNDTLLLMSYKLLGLAHALQKPVVLVSSNEKDVPFDLHHIRVIYYDVTDPFWGSKLIDKIAENVLSAIKNPEEAILKSNPE